MKIQILPSYLWDCQFGPQCCMKLGECVQKQVPVSHNFSMTSKRWRINMLGNGILMQIRLLHSLLLR
eukprot:Gb_28621 [translate_table: standard]